MRTQWHAAILLRLQCSMLRGGAPQDRGMVPMQPEQGGMRAAGGCGLGERN